MKEASSNFLLIKKGSAFIFPLNLKLFHSILSKNKNMNKVEESSFANK